MRYFFPAQDLTATNFQWTLDHPGIIARAMTTGGDTLFLAGPPDFLDERQAFHHPEDPEVQADLKRQAEAFEGKDGGQLWTFNKADGQLTARYALHSIPVFDGMAAVEDGLYLTTVDGRVTRLAGKGGIPLRKVDDEPVRIAWDQPEDPGYLLPPAERKEGDFSKVTRCKVIASKLGYRLRGTGKKQVGIAVKKLDRPITGSVTFRVRMKAVTGGRGLRSNGYLAFGDGVRDAALIKCGARLRTQQASIIQGPLLKGKAKDAKINVPDDKDLEMIVKVDLKTQNIVYTINGVTIEDPIERPLESITHVGYAMDSALIDFTPVEVQTP